MRQALILASILIGSVTGFAQSAHSNYLNYYRAIAQAEACIVNARYPEALNIYQKTFEVYAFNNPIDCYIAAQTASVAGDSGTCLNYLKKGMRFGLPIQTIRSNPHLKKSIETLSQNTIDSCWGIYQNSIDHDARSKAISLIQRDQQIIHQATNGSIYQSDGHTLKPEYRPAWDSLMNELITLIRKAGFPAQKTIGTQNGDDTLFRISPNAAFVIYIFIHHGRAWNQVSELLWTELQKGNMTPQMYGVIYEVSTGKGPYETPVHYFAARYCQEKACRKIVRDHLAEINKSRNEIGLCSYEVMQKKIESTAKYRRWIRGSAKPKETVFDFECDLNFQQKQ